MDVATGIPGGQERAVIEELPVGIAASVVGDLPGRGKNPGVVAGCVAVDVGRNLVADDIDAGLGDDPIVERRRRLDSLRWVRDSFRGRTGLGDHLRASGFGRVLRR